MKKTLISLALIFFAGNLLIAQRPACLGDAVYALTSLKQIPKAKNFLDDCFKGNEHSAEAWLVRANVYLQAYEYELERSSKDKRYAIRWPDALLIANESFYKALELKPDIKAETGLFDTKDGQLLTAPVINDLALKAMARKDYDEAIKLLNLVIRSYRADPKGSAEFLGYALVDLANCYKSKGDDANYKKILLDATKLNVAVPDIYLNLYDIYKQENDTVKCGEILNSARKALPGNLDVRGYELDYFAMVKDTTKLKNAAVQMFEEYKDNPAVINIVAGHLINNKEYALAEEMINTGLKIVPENFDLNQQMGYRYNCEALDYAYLTEELKKQKKYTPAQEALKKATEIFQLALPWAEKAFNINNEDRDNNIMLSRIYVRLQMPVPEELKAKVDSYYKQ